MEAYIESQNQPSSAETFDINATSRRSLSIAGPQLSGPDYRSEMNRSVELDVALTQPLPISNLASPMDRLREGKSSSGSVLSPLVYPNTSSASASNSKTLSSAAISPVKRMITPLDYNINLLPDANSEPLQPVVGQNPSDLNRSHGTAGLLDLAPSADRIERRGDALTQQILGSSTLAPAIAAPAESRLMKPRPAVLEVPKRKF